MHQDSPAPWLPDPLRYAGGSQLLRASPPALPQRYSVPHGFCRLGFSLSLPRTPTSLDAVPQYRSRLHKYHTRAWTGLMLPVCRRVGCAEKDLPIAGTSPRSPPPNRTCPFPSIRLSSDLLRGRVAAPFTQDTRNRFGDSHYAYLPAFECPIT